MTFQPSDTRVLRKQSFASWEEIVEAVLLRRRQIKATLEERKDWFVIQNNIGMEE
jgi:hypothetical protein